MSWYEACERNVCLLVLECAVAGRLLPAPRAVTRVAPIHWCDAGYGPRARTTSSRGRREERGRESSRQYFFALFSVFPIAVSNPLGLVSKKKTIVFVVGSIENSTVLRIIYQNVCLTRLTRLTHLTRFLGFRR